MPGRKQRPNKKGIEKQAFQYLFYRFKPGSREIYSLQSAIINGFINRIACFLSGIRQADALAGKNNG
jgi:hypothetical protein